MVWATPVSMTFPSKWGILWTHYASQFPPDWFWEMNSPFPYAVYTNVRVWTPPRASLSHYNGIHLEWPSLRFSNCFLAQLSPLRSLGKSWDKILANMSKALDTVERRGCTYFPCGQGTQQTSLRLAGGKGQLRNLSVNPGSGNHWHEELHESQTLFKLKFPLLKNEKHNPSQSCGRTNTPQAWKVHRREVIVLYFTLTGESDGGERSMGECWRWMKVPQTHQSHLSSVARITSHWPTKVSVRQTAGGYFYTLGQGFPISRLHTSTSCQISGGVRLKIKSTIHMMHVNHSQTFLSLPVHGKTVPHEISPWCQKGCGPLLQGKLACISQRNTRETECWGSLPWSPSCSAGLWCWHVFPPTERRASGRPDSFSQPPVTRSVSGTKPALGKADFTHSKTGNQRMRLSVQLVWSRKMLNWSFIPLATGRLQGKTSSSISTFHSLYQGHGHRRQNCRDLTLPLLSQWVSLHQLAWRTQHWVRKTNEERVQLSWDWPSKMRKINKVLTEA